MDPALVVGLGNPGPEYDRTRHNAGFAVVDLIASRLDARLRALKGVRAFAAETRHGERRVILAKPTTYMNLSGEAVRELARYYKVDVADVVVVHDDLDLPLGTIRVKRGGGDAGHNGLKHITRALGTPDYARVRIGIGRPSGRVPTADYVLQPFRKEEHDTVGVVLEQAADAALSVLSDGLEATQNKIHGEPPQRKERRVRAQAVVQAPVEQVWQAWTTEEGVTSFFGPRARIDARPGGAYEVLFDLDAAAGSQGSEGCTFVALDPPNTVSFTWNTPPNLGKIRDERTTVHVALRAFGKDRTRVVLTHTGWGEGRDWDRAYDYFSHAWQTVLTNLERRFVDGPLDWAVRR